MNTTAKLKYQSDYAELPFENEQFDVIISNGVFSLITDKLQVFKEIYRVLKPNILTIRPMNPCCQ